MSKITYFLKKVKFMNLGLLKIIVETILWKQFKQGQRPISKSSERMNRRAWVAQLAVGTPQHLTSFYPPHKMNKSN